MDYYSFCRPLLFLLPPETAHHAAIFALRSGMLPKPKNQAWPRLSQDLFGLHFPTCIGLAAGFDKNAEAPSALLAQGFGFVEAGTVTPKPQAGNPQPRMFRLRNDNAVINRLGFNNQGMARYAENMKKAQGAGIIGVNIGKNRDTEDAVADYLTLLDALAPYASYITVNISSPNTQGLRALQARDALDGLLEVLTQRRTGRPLLLKVAPDLSEEEVAAIAEVALARHIDGLIVGNTTVSRPPLSSPHAEETGGLSGTPLMPLSTRTQGLFYKHLQGSLPIIGAGGVSSGADAYAKIRAGASLVQLYTALVYQGFGLLPRIHRELDALLARDGFTHVSQAIGKDITG